MANRYWLATKIFGPDRFGIILMIILASSIVGQSQIARTQRSGPKPTTSGNLTAQQIAHNIAQSLVVVTTEDINGNLLGQASGFYYGATEPLLNRKTGDRYGDGLNAIWASLLPDGFPKNPNKDGSFVISNLHVFKRAWTARVRPVGSSRSYAIKSIVAVDPKHDLCVFEVEGFAAKPLMLGNPDAISIGSDVYVGGNPRGLENTLSKGIVSGIRKADGFLQIDAAISPGSSGGPVVNSSGHVLGVATASLSSGQNLNFAVSSEHILALRLRLHVSVKEVGAFAISDAEEDGLVGQVKIVMQTSAKIAGPTDDLYAVPVRPETRTTYNQEGNQIQWIQFDEDGTIAAIMETEYDRSGMRRKLGMKSKSFADGETIYTDEENFRIKLEQRSFSTTKVDTYKAKSGLPVTETKTYDRNGNLSERIRRASDGSYSRTVYEFDNQARCIKESEYRDGTIFSVTTYKYSFDATGNWTAKTAYLWFPNVANMEPIANSKVIREITYF